MSFPYNIHIGQAVIPIHFVCETLAYTVGYRYYVYLRKSQPDAITDSQRMLIFIGAALGAFLGSHIIGVLERSDLLTAINWRFFMANTTIVGGLLGGLIGVELVKRQIGVRVSSGDVMVYPVALAMIIGRTGCFLAGITDGTYGIPSNLPWAINLGDGLPRHPTSLYEIIFWMLLWLCFSLIERQWQFANGGRFKLLMVVYLLFRFFIEFIKPTYFFSFGLCTIQLACLAGLLYYYKVFVYPSKLFVSHA